MAVKQYSHGWSILLLKFRGKIRCHTLSYQIMEALHLNVF